MDPYDLGVDSRYGNVHFTDATHGIITGRDILYTADGGSTWRATRSYAYPGYGKITFYDEDFGVVLNGGAMYCFTLDGGVTWSGRGFSLYRDLYGVSFEDDSTILAVGEQGTIVRIPLCWID